MVNGARLMVTTTHPGIVAEVNVRDGSLCPCGDLAMFRFTSDKATAAACEACHLDAYAVVAVLTDEGR